MPTAVYGGSGTAFPPQSSPPPPTAAPGSHLLQIIDGNTGRPIPQARVRIDAATDRIADSGGRLVIPRQMLRPGAHKLAFTASTYTPFQMDVTIGEAPLLQTIRLRRVGTIPDPVAPPEPLALSFGDYTTNLNIGAPSIPSEITGSPPIGLTVVAVNNDEANRVPAVLVGATEAITWLIEPDITDGGADVSFAAAGNSIVASIDGTDSTVAEYAISATHAGTTYGPITLQLVTPE